MYFYCRPPLQKTLPPKNLWFEHLLKIPPCIRKPFPILRRASLCAKKFWRKTLEFDYGAVDRDRTDDLALRLPPLFLRSVNHDDDQSTDYKRARLYLALIFSDLASLVSRSGDPSSLIGKRRIRHGLTHFQGFNRYSGDAVSFLKRWAICDNHGRALPTELQRHIYQKHFQYQTTP